jgi:hypothetical protein
LRRDPWWQDQTGGSSHESTRLVSTAAQIEPMVIPASNKDEAYVSAARGQPAKSDQIRTFPAAGHAQIIPELCGPRHEIHPHRLLLSHRRQGTVSTAQTRRRDHPASAVDAVCRLPLLPRLTSFVAAMLRSPAGAASTTTPLALAGRSLHNALPHHPCRQEGGVAGMRL